ncbi:FAD binding domain protein [Enhygromyxa salina]|uniref:Delta(24)-sterol reductase n=1 Tax=Enhygromyxa salina TaxID=215803 RepID=A0A2S9YJN9_9BACT|nr:FAD-binding protein [Enhygromyxa salina]PRQ05323.1 FAD binding domain protein [Enhygromyxa salina]
MDAKKLALDLLTRYRSVVLVGVGLPVGLAFEAALRVRTKLYDLLGAAPERHDEKVRDIQDQVSRWAAQPEAERKPMCTDRKTWMNLSTRFEPKHRWHQVRMGKLRDILSVDLEARTVHVEPFVTVGQATSYLIDKGYMLAVNLEIAEATLGGLAMAVGMTTHSHKVGLLSETVVAYELVTAQGELLRVTADSHPDLYRALPWSHGTLGLLVGLELKIIPVKSHVHLRYEPSASQAQYCARINELATMDDAPDFLEATVYSREQAVIIKGEFAEPITPEQKAKINPIGRWYKPWFYTHVRQYLRGEGDEYIPLRHYLLRHNRSIFWVVEHMIPGGNHPVFRALLGWMMPPKIAFLKFSTTPAVRKMTFTKQVFQDITLPMSAMAQAVNRSDELFDIYPILLYPCRIYDRGPGSGQLRHPAPEDRVEGTDHAMYFDLGVYGVPGPIQRGEKFKTVHAMREMEAFTQSVRGFPFLYADTFMTRAEFEEMFDLSLYREVRAKYGAQGAFPDLYDKIKPELEVLAVLDEEDAWELDGERAEPSEQAEQAEVIEGPWSRLAKLRHQHDAG